jgi:hypothetical protein
MADKIDLKKVFKDDYVAAKKPVLLTVGKATYLTITGRGAPGGPEFEARVGALYAMAYTVKMTRKFAGEQDYTIGSLEAQWWTDDGRCLPDAPREQWRWRLLIRTPDFVTHAELANAAGTLRKKGKAPEASEVKLETVTEGRCVQMLHVGPYDREGDTMAVMTAFAGSKGLTLHGLHREIYISDPRRVPAEKLKTILRQPVK